MSCHLAQLHIRLSLSSCSNHAVLRGQTQKLAGLPTPIGDKFEFLGGARFRRRRHADPDGQKMLIIEVSIDYRL